MLKPNGGFFSSATRILCLGAHSDDIEIGCGGTILSLVRRNADIQIDWVVLSAEGLRAQEARDGAHGFLARATRSNVHIHAFRERYFPFDPDIKSYLDELGRGVNPDVVFAPWREDFHQDHRVMGELAAQTFRDQLVLEYEIPKYDGDLGRPNAYVHLTKDLATEKVRGILQSFPSQGSRPWFTEETFRGLMRLRGIECRAPEGYAEAFHAHKIVLA